jgi:DNA (cytosine-5)-methyltransferase 1
MAALQTFPVGYEITGSYSAGRRQLGNAVPSAIGELLGWEIHKVLDKAAPEALTLIPKQRSDCPEPEAPVAVPSRFLDLCADHAAHPGTGQGPGASKRAAVGDVPASVYPTT